MSGQSAPTGDAAGGQAPRRADVPVGVLAGGGGSRIGGSKALVPLGGAPLITYPLAAARAAGLRALVVAKRDTALPPLAERVLIEPDLPRHPLCGVLALLRELASDPGGPDAAIVLACDMPNVPGALLAHMAAAPPGALAAAPGGRPEPLLARYPCSALAELEQALARELPMRRALSDLSPTLLGDRELAAFGDPARICMSVNDPDALAEAEGAR